MLFIRDAGNRDENKPHKLEYTVSFMDVIDDEATSLVQQVLTYEQKPNICSRVLEP